MIEYFFLLVLALAYLIFAIVQDLRTTEIANWLTFSFIVFTLTYRAFYAVVSNDIGFFTYGFIGVGCAVVLGFLCYYGRMFAGGDAKLLMGFGAMLPATNIRELGVYGGIFFGTLLVAGAIYSLIYSLFLAARNFKKFRKSFVEEFFKLRYLLAGLGLLGLVLSAVSFRALGLIPFVLLAVLSLICVYVLSLEKGVMIKVVHWGKLREGDWLEQNIKIGGKVIKKSVHGLTKQDIDFLKLHRKSVSIRTGIPFTPAFLLAFVFMALFFLALSIPSLDFGFFSRIVSFLS